MDSLEVIVARPEQLQQIYKIYQNAIDNMDRHGIHQWDAIYPNIKDLEEDISKQEMYVVMSGTAIVAAYVLNAQYDDEYNNGNWKYTDIPFMVIHRLCVDPEYQNQGYAKKIMIYIEDVLRSKGIEVIRLDTFTENPYSLKLYRKLGFTEAGYVHWRKGQFILMEKKITKQE